MCSFAARVSADVAVVTKPDTVVKWDYKTDRSVSVVAAVCSSEASSSASEQVPSCVLAVVAWPSMSPLADYTGPS